MEVSGQFHGPAELSPVEQEAWWSPEPSMTLRRMEAQHLSSSARNIITVRTELYRLK
jgi:hypothetical protein